MAYKAVIKLEMQAKSLEDFYTNLSKISKKNIRSLKALEEQAKKTFGGKMRGRIESFGKSMNSLSSKTRGMRIAAAVGFGAAIKVASDFEMQMMRTRFLMGKTKDEFAGFEAIVRNIAKQSMFNPVEVSTTAKELRKTGMSMQQIGEQLPNFVKFAQFAEGDLTQTSLIMSKAFANLADTGQSSKSFLNDMAIGLSSTSLNIESLTEVLRYATGSMKNYEGSFIDTVAVMGALSDSMVEGSRGGTGLRGMFTQMAAPTKTAMAVLERYAKVAGTSTSAFVTKGVISDWRTFFKVLDVGASKSENKLKDINTMFGKITGASVNTLLTDYKGGNVLDKVFGNFEKEKDKKRNLSDIFAIDFDKTTFKKMKNFMSQLQELAVQIGDSGLLEAFGKMLGMAKPLFEWFGGLSETTKKWVVGISLAAAAVIALIPAVASLVGLAVTLAGLSLPAGVLTGIAIAIGTVAALVTALVMDWRGLWESFSNSVVGIFSSMGDLIHDIFSGTWDDVLKDFKKLLWDMANASSGGILGWVSEQIGGYALNSEWENYKRGSKEGGSEPSGIDWKQFGSTPSQSSASHSVNINLSGDGVASQTIKINNLSSSTSSTMNVGEQ